MCIEPLVICGDFNIYIDDESDPYSTALTDLLQSMALKQHVCIPTHDHGHTLDLRGSVPKNGPIDFASKKSFFSKLCRWKGFGTQILKLDFFFEKYLFLLHYGGKLILGDFSLLVVDFKTKICRC